MVFGIVFLRGLFPSLDAHLDAGMVGCFRCVGVLKSTNNLAPLFGTAANTSGTAHRWVSTRLVWMTL